MIVFNSYIIEAFREEEFELKLIIKEDGFTNDEKRFKLLLTTEMNPPGTKSLVAR